MGNAKLRVSQRFVTALHYRPIISSDDYTFTVSLDFTGISSFSTQYASSPCNSSFDVYINGGFVGRVIANSTAFGVSELQFATRFPTLPELPLPPGFPTPVAVGDFVSVFIASATLPDTGAASPSGSPLFSGAPEEKFVRGDVTQDGHVDLLDFPYLADNYDPFHLLGAHVGPMAGDFNGDNLTDLADYKLFVTNWDNHDDPPSAPAPIATKSGDVNLDGVVDLSDLGVVLANYGRASGATLAEGDLDADGDVDLSDLGILLSNFGL